ncbi:hypothetical protein K502DRAFT_259765 [Neoconidiobolus thromboides FSU 785]|nr:hypothetical protein K502DRAFT_259765 [Neoconidiobolus thromboides FSU 785]
MSVKNNQGVQGIINLRKLYTTEIQCSLCKTSYLGTQSLRNHYKSRHPTKMEQWTKDCKARKKVKTSKYMQYTEMDLKKGKKVSFGEEEDKSMSKKEREGKSIHPGDLEFILNRDG